ncbi:uncharacterized protein LOC141655585 [Silene latifolia]|uniref:uncharacterized protein LOC141655585 n=1 Tax=Silene latifolia TaxID=37657 RepID=UPI003D77DB1B
MNREGKQAFINEFMNNNNVSCFGLLETKVKSCKLNKVQNNIFEDWSVSTNNAYHRGGRVWVLWKPQMVDIQFLEYDPQYIHLHIRDLLHQRQFYLTFIYAFKGIGERESLWTNLRRIAGTINGPWSLGGDFNCVLTGTERLGGPISNAEADPFQACLNTCGLTNMKATGAYYTWNNKQPPETRVYSRLDRILVNQDWLHRYPNPFANFLPEGMFYHTPCLVSESLTLGSRKRSFKFFNIWSTAPGFLECVSTNWRNSVYGTKMFNVVRKLKMLKLVLRKINRDHFSDIENTADIAHTKLIMLQKELMNNPGDMELMR